MVNWLLTLGFPVQTNTDGSFVVVLRQCMWSDGKNIGNYSNLARMLSNNVRNITRQSLKAEPLPDSWTVGCHLVNDI